MSDNEKRTGSRRVIPVRVIDLGDELDKMISQLVEVAVGYGVLRASADTTDQQFADSERIVLECAEDVYTAFENVKELRGAGLVGIEISVRLVTESERRK